MNERCPVRPGGSVNLLELVKLSVNYTVCVLGTEFKASQREGLAVEPSLWSSALAFCCMDRELDKRRRPESYKIRTT